MVLKGLPYAFKPFAIHITQRDETMPFAESKTKLLSYEDTEKMGDAATENNVKAHVQKQRGGPDSISNQGTERAAADLACFK